MALNESGGDEEEEGLVEGPQEPGVHPQTLFFLLVVGLGVVGSGLRLVLAASVVVVTSAGAAEGTVRFRCPPPAST